MTAKLITTAFLAATLTFQTSLAQGNLPSTLTLECGMGATIEFVLVPQGTFLMGSQNEDPSQPNYNPEGPQYFQDESPVHEVTLPAFYIAKYEVTKEIWVEIMGGSVDYNELNVAQGNMSYDDALSFISTASAVVSGLPSGATLAIPSEEQWECAARGGPDATDNYPYAGAATPSDVAIFGGQTTIPKRVGTKQPNSLGIYDMCGNAREWTTGDYLSYADGSRLNNNYIVKVLRGGDVGSRYNSLVTLSDRAYDKPATRQQVYGLRPVINIPQQASSITPSPLESSPLAPYLTTRCGQLFIILPSGGMYDLSGRPVRQ